MANLKCEFEAGVDYSDKAKLSVICPVTWAGRGKHPATLGFKIRPSEKAKQCANYDFEGFQGLLDYLGVAKNHEVRKMAIKAVKLFDEGVAFDDHGNYEAPKRKSAKPKVENTSGKAKMTKADARELKEAGFSASEVMAEVEARGGWAAE
mgnify:FL=1